MPRRLLAWLLIFLALVVPLHAHGQEVAGALLGSLAALVIAILLAFMGPLREWARLAIVAVAVGCMAAQFALPIPGMSYIARWGFPGWLLFGFVPPFGLTTVALLLLKNGTRRPP
jgi:hypothetical protein